MAELNNKSYKDWKDYIRDKFPDSDFAISETIDASGLVCINVNAKSGYSATTLFFDFPSPGLCRATFYNPKSRLHGKRNDEERKRALFYEDYLITDDNLKSVDEYLDIPLYYGWTEEAIFYKDALVISEVRYFGEGTWNVLWSENKLSWSNKAGCLLNLVAWPILMPQHRYIYRKLARSSNEKRVVRVEVEPMSGRRHGLT